MSNIFEDWGFIGGAPKPKPPLARRIVDGVCIAILIVPMALAMGVSWVAEKLGIRY